jgi:hypothetical protein
MCEGLAHWGFTPIRNKTMITRTDLNTTINTLTELRARLTSALASAQYTVTHDTCWNIDATLDHMDVLQKGMNSLAAMLDEISDVHSDEEQIQIQAAYDATCEDIPF